MSSTISWQRRLVSKFRKKRTPPNLPCQIQIRTRKKERSSSVISWQWRLVSKNRKRRTTHNLPCRVQLRTQKMERSSSIISWQWRLISKNSKRHTLPDLPCQVQVRFSKNGKVVQNILEHSFVKSLPSLIYHAKSKYALDKRKGHLPSYLGNEGLYKKTVKGVPPIIHHAESNYALKKWKGRLPSYRGNEGSYQKTGKGILSRFTMPSPSTHSKNGKVVFPPISTTKARIKKP